MKVIAVVVTYNRLPLLKKNLRSLSEQTRPPDDVIVINNGSTDDTEQWLSEQSVISYTQPNNGGAGGFSYGINKAYTHGADWIWLMDDDSIPQQNALQELLTVLHRLKLYIDQIGFLSSTVLWTDGNPHELNKTYLLKDKRMTAGFAFAAEANMPLIQWGSFVSMLLSAKAVQKVGLPLKEFFIWGDDVEYSKRIISNGMAGLAVKDSIVIHETPANHQSNILKDPESAVWKYRYGLRNELFTKRRHDGAASFWISWIHRLLIMPFRILLTRKNHRWPFIKVVWKTSLSALFFHPVIERADSLQTGSSDVTNTVVGIDNTTIAIGSSTSRKAI